MKKISVVFVLLLVFVFSGCSISNSRNVKIENEKLKNQVNDLQQEIVASKQEGVIDNQGEEDELKSLQTKSPEQLYQDPVSHYSYICPGDFTLSDRLDFNGKIKVSSCSKNYTNSKFEFIDGVSVGFEFVPTNLSNTEMNGDKLWSDQKLEIKSADGAKTYDRNSFSGWMSAVPESGYGYINFIARRAATNGYYEVNATIALYGNNNPSVEDRMTIVNKIVDSFSVKK